MRAGGTVLLCLRNFQYSRTANFRAMATFATAVPRRNFNQQLWTALHVKALFFGVRLFREPDAGNPNGAPSLIGKEPGHQSSK